MERYLEQFRGHLESEEKSRATIEKYMRDARAFLSYAAGRAITKRRTIQYKESLIQRYAPASVNSMLVAVNSFLRFSGREDCCVRLLKIQRQIFCRKEKELSRGEYKRLLQAARGTRLSLILQTICGTGIRISELKYIMVEAVREGRAVVDCKNKMRVILIPRAVQRELERYITKTGLKTGAVFTSRTGRPLDRSNIWREMKALCREAHVAPEKVFPHNLRHLFARTFYSIEKDIVRLADLLGHASIDTTRIYTIESGSMHISSLEKVQRLLTT